VTAGQVIQQNSWELSNAAYQVLLRPFQFLAAGTAWFSMMPEPKKISLSMMESCLAGAAANIGLVYSTSSTIILATNGAFEKSL
jgi:hypothetical protein